jgi:hypothetical protein
MPGLFINPKEALLLRGETQVSKAAKHATVEV